MAKVSTILRLEDWVLGDFDRINRIYRIGIISRGDAEARGIGELENWDVSRRGAERQRAQRVFGSWDVSRGITESDQWLVVSGWWLVVG